jgi:hypothetical protein
MIRRLGKDHGTGAAGALAVGARIFYADLNDVRSIGLNIALGNGEAALAGAHLDAVIGDAQAHGKAEGPHQPVCRDRGIGVNQNRDYGAGWNGAIREHDPI